MKSNNYDVKNDFINERNIPYYEVKLLWFNFLVDMGCNCQSKDDHHFVYGDCDSTYFDISDIEEIMNVQITITNGG